MIHFTCRNLDFIVISVLFYIKQRYFRLIVCFIFYLSIFIVKTGNLLHCFYRFLTPTNLHLFFYVILQR